MCHIKLFHAIKNITLKTWVQTQIKHKQDITKTKIWKNINFTREQTLFCSQLQRSMIKKMVDYICYNKLRKTVSHETNTRQFIYAQGIQPMVCYASFVLILHINAPYPSILCIKWDRNSIFEDYLTYMVYPMSAVSD